MIMPARILPPNFYGSSGADIVTAGTSAFNDTGIRVDASGVLDTRAGNDVVIGTASGETGYGIFNVGEIQLGCGNDLLLGAGSFAGLSGGGVFDAGDGNDVVNGIANSTGFAHNAYGIDGYGRLTGGDGDDLIRGEAYGVVPGNQSGGILWSGVLTGGNGNDTIIGIGVNQSGIGAGIRSGYGGSIEGGDGQDLIAGYGTTTGIGFPSYSLPSGGTTIDGGSGDDRFFARIIDSNGTPTDNQGGAVANALILGGKGDDVFDVGYGNAALDGGEGYDTLVLPGAMGEYCMEGCSTNFQIMRDGYTLTVSNFERVLFSPDAPWC
jgi:hypothetical protein